MLVFNLNGNSSQWKLTSYTVGCNTRNKRSSLHLQARDLLRQFFPTLILLEEVAIQVFPRKTLFLDFFLPLNKLAVEVHGQQHYKFTALYHTTPMGFRQQCQNDTYKAEWCKLNDIGLIILPYDEDIDEWTKKLKQYC